MITSDNTPDLPGWLDLGSPDPGASAEFYRQVFGWTAELQPADDAQMQYHLLMKDGQVVAGLGGLMDPGAQPAWMIYTRVADARATTAKAEAHGAKVRVPFMEVGAPGAFAQLTDPSGAEFALWQPGDFTGFARCCEDDSLLWVELWTRDPAAAKDFYPAVFGWRSESFPMPEGSYDMWTTDPADQFASFGGIMPIADGMPTQDEKWIPYFMVADPDVTIARATDAGGTVLMPAEDSPAGRIAALADQFGARFSIIKPAPMQ